MRERHGMTGTPEYRSWAHARGRCLNPNDKKYPAYGARGIKMCKAWACSFTAFYKHMGSRPEGTSLDRIDNDGDYEPGNCRWGTPAQQSVNTRDRKDNTSGVRGVTYFKPTGKWAAYICRGKKRMHLGHFLSLEEASKARLHAQKVLS